MSTVDSLMMAGRPVGVKGVSTGVAQFGQIGSPFIEGFGEVSFDRVAIEKPDGRRVEVADGKVEDLNPFGMSGLPVPADLRMRQLTIPGLTPGDRLT